MCLAQSLLGMPTPVPNPCSEHEECRYECGKENCGYKCYISPEVLIWAPIVAVASALILGLLIFIGVRHFRSKAKEKNTTGVERNSSLPISDQGPTENSV